LTVFSVMTAMLSGIEWMYSAMIDSQESHVRCHVTELMDRSKIT